jgi:hypothetical protein
MNSASRSGLFALPLLLALGLPAQAQEVEIGTGLICDTQAQVEHFVSLYDGDVQSTAEKVNTAEHSPTACIVSGMAYVRGRKVATARRNNTTFQIIPILVVGVVTEKGVETVTPAPYFSAIAVEEISI